MNQLYKATSISKQAVYQYASRQAVFDDNITSLVVEVDELRKAHPGCGVEKLHYTLKPDFIGRDRFVETFMALGYRLKRSKNYRRTTYSSKKYHPNLINGLVIKKPSSVWQSDITYIDVGGKFYYAVFIIDVYTRNIVGYQVSDHMRATANIHALKMALKTHKPPEIHHSDRGSQYVSKDYVSILKSCNCKISMGLSAQDNAYAERINRTIKEEYLDHWKPKSFYQLKACVNKAVANYNSIRIHNSIKKKSPENFEKFWSLIDINQRPKLSIFDNEKE